MLTENLVVDTGLVIHSLSIGHGVQLHQVAITFLIFCQKNQVIVVFSSFRGVPFMAASCSHVKFTADDGLDSRLAAGLFKSQHSEHVSVVRKSEGFHSQLLCPAYQVIDFCRGIQQRKIRVNVKVDKFLRAHGKKYIIALVKGEDSITTLEKPAKKRLIRDEKNSFPCIKP